MIPSNPPHTEGVNTPQDASKARTPSEIIAKFGTALCEGCEGNGDLSCHGLDDLCGMCDGTGRIEYALSRFLSESPEGTTKENQLQIIAEQAIEIVQDCRTALGLAKGELLTERVTQLAAEIENLQKRNAAIGPLVNPALNVWYECESVGNPSLGQLEKLGDALCGVWDDDELKDGRESFPALYLREKREALRSREGAA